MGIRGVSRRQRGRNRPDHPGSRRRREKNSSSEGPSIQHYIVQVYPGFGSGSLTAAGFLQRCASCSAVADLIRSADKAVLVTRFWYIRMLQPQTLQATGLTRDGLFLVENGKVTSPLMKFPLERESAPSAAEY
jgi:hypothetical protein